MPGMMHSMSESVSGAPAPAPSALASKGDRSTHFIFENKVFQIPDGYFSIVAGTDDPVFNVKLGDIWGKIPLSTIQQAFNISKDSPDAVLLDVVSKGLKYVREIRPGDSIPREILDGSASWTVEERHTLIAKGRLAAYLIAFDEGSDCDIKDRAQFARMAADPAIEEKAKFATETAARRVGLGGDKKQLVFDRIASLARELSYIEALRDRYGAVQMIQSRILQVSKIYKNDRHVQDEVPRMMALLRNPIGKYEDIFFQVDGQMSDIISTLNTFNAQIAFIRQARDELHQSLMLFDDLIEAWKAARMERTPETEAMLKRTYQFLAQNFLTTQVWKREQ